MLSRSTRSHAGTAGVPPARHVQSQLGACLLLLLTAFLLAFCVRFLTLQFMRAHLNDAGWFQVGSYAKFDRQAHAILEGKQKLFWIDDPTRTDLAQYPPAFPVWVALIYKFSSAPSSYAVQTVQWL